MEDLKMGFFQDLKEDLSQAVNELLPEESAENKDMEKQGIQDETTNATDQQLAEDAELIELAALLEKMDELDKVEAEKANLNTEETKNPQVNNVLETDSLSGTTRDNTITEEPGFYKTIKEQEHVKEGIVKMEETNKSVTDETAVITLGMTITGDISSTGSIDIIGTVLGNIDALGKLNITGCVQGNSKAAEVFADSAKITGEVVSEGSVKIGQASVVIGNITASSAVIAGAVKGDIDVRGPVILDTSAIVMGNIKSKSVQINNGAVIEGLCSQCYAEVNPTAFFEDIKKKTIKK
jgi:cytoskeletal protein CcmA (bactofilin family)